MTLSSVARIVIEEFRTAQGFGESTTCELVEIRIPDTARELFDHCFGV